MPGRSPVIVSGAFAWLLVKSGGWPILRKVVSKSELLAGLTSETTCRNLGVHVSLGIPWRLQTLRSAYLY